MISPSTQNAMAQALQLLQRGQIEQARQIYASIVDHEPSLADAHNGLGLTQMLQREFAAAAASFAAAFSLQPGNASIINNHGIALHQLARFDEAIAAHVRAIQLNPDWPIPHVNLAMLLLLKGDYTRGFIEHEWRLKVLNLRTRPQEFSQPRWDGSPIAGKRILIHPEQGFGDSIQCIRFLPQVADRGGEIVLATPPELRELFRSSPHAKEVVTRGDALPGFDLHCPLLSLPHALRTTIDSLPGVTGYLSAPTEKIAPWRERFKSVPQPRRIGLAWSGNSAHGADRERSITLQMLGKLLQIPDIAWVRLQRDSVDPLPPTLIDWTRDLRDFSDTAGLIHHLDLVITIDSAVAHLAGAMGKPAWVLIPFVPDWRWMLDRTDSPWYSSLRLFRQPAPGDWSTPINHIIAELRSGELLD